MNACELSAMLSTLATLIAETTPNDDELAVIALAFTQLGFTLNTIAAQRALMKKL